MLRRHKFRGRDRLPHMALCVVSDMNQKLRNSSGQSSLAHSPRFSKLFRVEGTNAHRAVADGSIKF